MVVAVPPIQFLDDLQQQVSAIQAARRKDHAGNAALGVLLDQLLDGLDTFVNRMYDRYATLEDAPTAMDEPERVTLYHLQRANQVVSNILLRLVSSECVVLDDKDDERMEHAARLMAHLSGRGAAGAITSTWHIPFVADNGQLDTLQVRLHEPTYIGNDIGFKTWGAAPLMAKLLVQQKLIPDLQAVDVLELGTGTGLVGIVCDLLGARSVTVTDYHPSVLTNVAVNIELNQSRCQVAKLDFIHVAQAKDTSWAGKRFPVVIASDLLYEMDHAENLPVAVDQLMADVFYFMIPLRPTHWDEVSLFETKMQKVGLYQRRTTDTEQEEDEGIVRYRLYEYTRNKK
ncbi:putative methyltransferase-domain-containing protein [Gongronella butleri]|nr:putative methyltransferase-domain-containing protein [Gongronella butleri]